MNLDWTVRGDMPVHCSREDQRHRCCCAVRRVAAFLCSYFRVLSINHSTDSFGSAGEFSLWTVKCSTANGLAPVTKPEL